MLIRSDILTSGYTTSKCTKPHQFYSATVTIIIRIQCIQNTLISILQQCLCYVAHAPK